MRPQSDATEVNDGIYEAELDARQFAEHCIAAGDRSGVTERVGRR